MDIKDVKQLEDESIKVLEDRTYYELNRDMNFFRTDDKVGDAARQLGRLRSQRAILPLVNCIITMQMYDVRGGCRNALVAIGKPALGPITDALSKNPPSWVLKHPVYTLDRQFLVQAKERIEGAFDSNIQDDKGVDIHDGPLA